MIRYGLLFGAVVCAVACGGSSENDHNGSVAGAGGSSSSSGGTTSSSSGGSSSSSGGSSSSSGGTSSSSGGTSSSSAGTSSGGSGGIPLQNLPLAFSTAGCEKLFECCTAEELMSQQLVGETAEECSITLAAFLSLIVAPIQSSVTAGRAEYDGVALQECLDMYTATSCADARNGTADPASGCGQFLVPKVELGGDCAQSFDCIDGWCDEASGNLCAPKKEDGSECVDDAECQSGYCDTVAGCGVEPASTDNLCSAN